MKKGGWEGMRDEGNLSGEGCIGEERKGEGRCT